MTIIININRLKLYNAYKGDIDSLLRMNSKKHEQVFGNDFDNAWAIISSKLQDIELITKRLSSQDYSARTLKELKEICDKESFEALTGKIKFYADFQTVAAILQDIKGKITSETDTIWAGFDSVETLLNDISQDIQNIELCDFTTLHNVYLKFLPTSKYQELSISNGWSDDYLKLAEKFERAYKKIMN